MNSRTNAPTDSLRLDSDLERSFRNYRPASTALTYQGVQPEDGVALSFESYEDDDYEDLDECEDLCGSLLAAWD